MQQLSSLQGTMAIYQFTSQNTSTVGPRYIEKLHKGRCDPGLDRGAKHPCYHSTGV